MPHAIWKGSVRFGLVNVPVGLYSAEERDDLSFTLLDSEDLAPVGYERVNKRTGEEVPRERIVKGYEVEDGRTVVLGDEDFRQADPEATRTIDIQAFVDVTEVDPMYYDRPYYLAPDGAGRQAYVLLREALDRTGRAGVAKVVLTTREHLALLVARGDALVLELLRFPYELRSTDELDLPGHDLDDLGIRDREIEMAETLIEGMNEAWDPTRYEDTYRDRLLARIQEKVAAGTAERVAEPAESAEETTGPEVVDLMERLKRSLDAVQGGKSKKGKKKRKRA